MPIIVMVTAVTSVAMTAVTVVGGRPGEAQGQNPKAAADRPA